MNRFNDYAALSRSIHAPEDLKHRVFLAAVSSGRKEKKTGGRYSRGWSFMQKAAVAAVLAIAIPFTAFAAARYFGLTDYLAESGMEDTQAVQELSVNMDQLESYCNDFAEYTIFEAVCDSNLIYVAAQIKPLDEGNMLVPQFVSADASVMELGLGNITEGTIGEYAASLGKSLVYADVGYWNGESHLDGTADFRYGDDGTLYYYYSAHNTFQTKNITLKCAGVAYTDGMSLANRVEFETKLFDRSTSKETVFTVFDGKAFAETGIRINSLTIQETELGMYATFTYEQSSESSVNFKLLDANGDVLASMPNLIGTGVVDNGDGTCSEMLTCQKLESLEGLQFMIRDFDSGEYFGPYSFE